MVKNNKNESKEIILERKIKYEKMRKIAFYLSKVENLSKKHNRSTICRDFKDILSCEKGEAIKESWHFNDEIEIDWVLNQYPTESKNTQIFMVCPPPNVINNTPDNVLPKNIKIVPPPDWNKYPHFVKMSIILFQNCCRIAIYSCSLRSAHWNNLTQLLWISEDLRFDIKDRKFKCCSFGEDLFNFLTMYNSPEINGLAAVVSFYNFDKIAARLVYSIPGEHQMRRVERMGVSKLALLVGKKLAQRSDTKTVIIATNMGKIDKDDRWSNSTLPLALTGGEKFDTDKFRIVYPSFHAVNTSIIPQSPELALKIYGYQHKLYKRYRYLTNIFREWSCDVYSRTHALPCMNLYFNINDNYSSVNYVMLSSIQLTRRSLGSIDESGLKILIKAYAVGIFIRPEYYENVNRIVPLYPRRNDIDPDKDVACLLPCDFPLKSYSHKTEPYMKDLLGRKLKTQ